MDPAHHDKALDLPEMQTIPVGSAGATAHQEGGNTMSDREKVMLLRDTLIAIRNMQPDNGSPGTYAMRYIIKTALEHIK